MGATTIWERWDSMLPDGSINPGEMTSFNHYALGAVADWLHRTVAGLAPAAPGYRRLLVRPRPGGGLTHARARHDTPYGAGRGGLGTNRRPAHADGRRAREHQGHHPPARRSGPRHHRDRLGAACLPQPLQRGDAMIGYHDVHHDGLTLRSAVHMPDGSAGRR